MGEIYICTDFQPIRYFRIYFCIESITFELVIQQQTFFIMVSTRQIIIDILRTSSDTQIIILCQTGLHHFINPIDIRA